MSLLALQQRLLPIIFRAANYARHQLPPTWQRPHIAPANVSPKQASTGRDSQDTGIPPEKSVDDKEPQPVPPAAHSAEPLSQHQWLWRFCRGDVLQTLLAAIVSWPSPCTLPAPHLVLQPNLAAPRTLPLEDAQRIWGAEEFGCRGAGPGHGQEEHPPALPKQAKVHAQDKGESSSGFICKRYETA